MATLTLFLMALGSATRVMNAGLSCPDWPLCYGEFVPKEQMNLQVFLEWFHRLIASSLGCLMIVLTGVTWWLKSRLPKWLPALTTLCLGLIIFQGVLGGLTVTQLLRFDIVTAHLATGLLFFSCMLVLGSSLMPYQGTGVVNRLPWLSSLAVVLVYGQSILGGLVASQWAAHQCLAGAQLCRIMNNHIAGVVPPSLTVLTLVFLSWRTPALHPYLRGLGKLALGLLGLQILVGLSTLRLHLQVVGLTVAHQAIGASLLGTLVIFSVIAIRDRHQAEYVKPLQTVPISITGSLEPS
ncbi:heme A synthase [Acaryochloris sp. IP29b_bin.148]|uniref:COX15/CtaA family protein n=1 Tax=Acaryochloris sp. IP29b_bin.148 TaxID=2969218 RepID=UPI00262E128D|nr:heme A synthase [Acaryochloris sp. IP29b_bin.148]